LHEVEERLRETVREEAACMGRTTRSPNSASGWKNQEGNLLSLLKALGQSCMEAAGRVPPAAPPAPPTPPMGGAEERPFQRKSTWLRR